jgi:hypothetical protein
MTLGYKLHFTTLLFLFCCCLTAQTNLTGKDWDGIIKLLIAEDWSKAEKATGVFLKKYNYQTDTGYEASNLRYMYLVSVAGQLAHKDIDKDKALKKVANIIGQKIVTPSRPFNHKDMFNCFMLNDDSTRISCCQANNINTEIQIFEYYQMNDSTLVSRPDKLADRELRIWGRIESIEAEGFAMPRLRVNYKGCYLYDE